jgi:AcrR family transcriptional regulator
MARPRQITDLQILDATRDAVLHKGAQVSLDIVAQQLGVTSPALIKRFGTRQNLILAALCPDEKELDFLFEAPIDERPFVEQVESLIDRVSQYFAMTLPRVMALRECGVSHEVINEKIKMPMPVRAVAAMTRWLKSMHRAGFFEDGEALETTATAIIGAITTRMIAAHLTKKPWSTRSQNKHQTELAALFARGLAAKKAPRALEKKGLPRS